MEAGRLGVQGQHQLHSESEASLGYIWPCLGVGENILCEHIHSLRHTNKMKVILVSKGGGAAREMAVTALSG